MDHDWDDDTPALDHLTPAARTALYEQARAAGNDATALRRLDLAQLRARAERECAELRPGLSHAELLALLLHERCRRSGMCLVSGVLEVLPDGYGFLRAPSHDYAAGPADVYVSPNQIHRLNLKSGHEIAGPVRLPRRGEQYLALLRVESVNGGAVGDLRGRLPFDQAVPVLPRQRLPLCARGDDDLDVRLIGLLSPWGRGQRVLVHAPPGAGRTRLCTRLVAAALAGNPDLHAMVCLLDERPEDLTEVRRAPGLAERCQVVATAFDAPPLRHLAVAELALAQCLRMVESGRHVLLCVDSLTALVRASQHELPPSGRLLVPGLEAPALLRSKRLFAAARNLEGGASLTVLATVLTGTDARIDDVIAGEFAGKGNADVVLDRQLAALRAFPALDLLRTATRREDLLLDATAAAGLRALRQRLTALPATERLAALRALLAAHADDDSLLRSLAP